ncbi:hypothetical protein B0H19DRAFT_887431, partial [Mycena capillaripes]
WRVHKAVCKSLTSKLDSKATPQGSSKPPTTHCTGCKLRFGGRIGEIDQTCPDCGYVSCESCSCHNLRGTCYCENSNFGHGYCGRIPEWYHYGAHTGKVYCGDNHPDKYDAELHAVPASQWEEEPRKYTNCGETKLCL